MTTYFLVNETRLELSASLWFANNSSNSLVELIILMGGFLGYAGGLRDNRPFTYSKKESGSNDISSHFVEVSNVYNSDRSSNATQSNLVYKNVQK